MKVALGRLGWAGLSSPQGLSRSRLPANSESSVFSASLFLREAGVAFVPLRVLVSDSGTVHGLECLLFGAHLTPVE